MLSRSEAKRRARQSARDKARHQEEQYEIARRRRQAFRPISSATLLWPSAQQDALAETKVHLKDETSDELIEQDMTSRNVCSVVPLAV